MENLVLFILASMGFTAILVDSSIMKSFRDLMLKMLPESVYKVFECYQCMGFWSGIINGAIILSFNPVMLFSCGCAGSVVSMFWGLFATYLEARSIVNLGDEK
jgi:hypothetical protein